MTMHLKRLVDLSLAFYIRNSVLSKEFSETREDDALIEVTPGIFRPDVPSNFVPNPFQRGRGLYYYDEITVSGYGPVADTSHEQLTRVIVKDEFDVIRATTDYTVGYNDGSITNPVGFTPTKITYDYSYVSVLDSYPDNRESEKLDLPFVAVDSSDSPPFAPLELGGGKVVYQECKLHVYANNTAERDDIVQVLKEGLENLSAKLYDFNNSNGFPLNYDGTYNNSFDPLQLDYKSRIFFEKVRDRDVPGTRDFTYGERYKNIIELLLEVYVSK